MKKFVQSIVALAVTWRQKNHFVALLFSSRKKLFNFISFDTRLRTAGTLIEPAKLTCPFVAFQNVQPNTS